MRVIFGKVDLLTPSLEDKEAIIPCRFDFDLKKKIRQKILQKSCGGQPNNYFWSNSKHLLSKATNADAGMI